MQNIMELVAEYGTSLQAFSIVCFLFIVFALFQKFNRHLMALKEYSFLQQQKLTELQQQLTRNIDISDKYQQQQYQQLSFNHQQLANMQQELKVYFEQQISSLKMTFLRQQNEHAEKQNQRFHQHQQSFNENQLKAIDQIIQHLNQTTQSNREELSKSLQQSSDNVAKRIEQLTSATDHKLQEISGQVEKRLTDGFEKTTKTFNDILQRLVLIDDAQKKITELSSNVVSLQEVLSDKRSRGAFGEVQLNALIRNVLPEQHFSLQHTLSNGKIADCVLFLPKPTGDIVIDSKFPLESYRTMMNETLAISDRKQAERQFKQDIKKHINDIADKYLIDKETADGAIMFIPAEAIFAEIHAHHSDLVEVAHQKRVWLASPTTLMAILTTSRSVLKDDATRQQIHIIQSHLTNLAQDFSRFKGRFANLAKHIDQAATDVKQIHTSANKISDRFEKIEQVELNEEKNAAEHGLSKPALSKVSS